jgi:hypothetical protein
MRSTRPGSNAPAELSSDGRFHVTDWTCRVSASGHDPSAAAAGETSRTMRLAELISAMRKS